MRKRRSGVAEGSGENGKRTIFRMGFCARRKAVSAGSERRLEKQFANRQKSAPAKTLLRLRGIF